MDSLSIIIPSRNRKEFVQQLIADLYAQTIPFKEIIVVDQSQTPYNLNSCTYFSITTTGPSQARNFGIKQAKGDILIFLDDDIRVEPNFLEKLVDPIIKGKSDASCGAICDAQGHYPRNSLSEWETKGDSWLKKLTANPNHPYSQYCLSFPGGCSAVKSRVLEKIGYFNEFFDPNGAGEDREMAIRLIKNGYSIFYNGQARIFHLASPFGGRRDLGNSSALLNINIGFIILTHFGLEEYKTYKRSLLKNSISKILRALLTQKDLRGRLKAYRFYLNKFTQLEKYNNNF